MSNELVEAETELVSVNVDDVPEIISSSIENISKLEQEVRKAEESASTAMDFVGKEMTRYEEKGKWIFKHRGGNTKDIIEDTQEAVEKLADAQQVSVKALTKSFEFQKKLAETSKYLFDLGCANITVNRVAVRAIELKMKGAGKGEISELAKQEMMAVVKQLKEQEDILKKQEFLTSKVKENVSRLKEKDTVDKAQSEKIESLKSENQLQNEKIINIHHNLSEKDRIDSEQTERLVAIRELLNIKDEVDKEQESSIKKNQELIIKNSEAIKVLYDYTKQKDVLDKEQSKEIAFLKEAQNNKLSITAIVTKIQIISATLMEWCRRS